MKAAELPVGDTGLTEDHQLGEGDPPAAQPHATKGVLGRVRPWAVENAPTLLGVAVGAGVALWLTADVWGARLPAGGDVTGHLVRTQAGIDLLQHGQLDGWSARFGVGYQQSLFYGPGFGWLLVVLRVLSLGTLSSAGALKVVMIGSVVAVPFGAAFLARCMGLSRRAAGIAAVLSLAASSPFGVGLHGLFGNGLVPQQVGGVLFLVALGAAIRTLTESGRGWQALLGVTVAAMAITHLISVAILALFLGCVLAALAVTRALTGDGIRRLVVSLGAGAGLAAFWVVPFLAHSDLHGPVATWSTPPFGTRIDDIFNGRVLYQPLVAKAVLVGMAYGFVRVGQRRPYALLVVLGPIVALAIGHWSIHAIPNELTLQIANRELGLAGLLMVFPLAAGIAALADRLNTQSVFAIAAALVAGTYLVVGPWHDVRTLARQAPPVTPEMRTAAAELARLVSPMARFTTVRDYPTEVGRTGTLQPDRWLAWASGRNTLSTFPIEVSSTPEVSALVDRVAHEPAERSAAALARYGVTHVVATSPQQVATLMASPRFRPVWAGGTVTILAVDGAEGEPPPTAQFTTEGPSTSTLVAASLNHLELGVDSLRPTRATVALAWSPKWHGSVDGRPVDLRRTADGLIAVDVPAGTNRVDLTFRHDGWDVVGLTISLLFVLGGLLLVVRRRGTNRPGAAGSAGSASGSDPGAELQLGQDGGQLGANL